MIAFTVGAPIEAGRLVVVGEDGLLYPADTPTGAVAVAERTLTAGEIVEPGNGVLTTGIVAPEARDAGFGPVEDSAPVSAAACWEVVAGLIPGGEPEAEFTRRWWLTAEDVGAQDNATRWSTARDAAYAYAKSITDPGSLNWVRVDWIWF